MRKLLVLLGFTLLLFSSNANAMSLTNFSTVLGFENYNGTNMNCSAPTDMNGAMFSMNGETVSIEAALNFYNDYGARKNAGGVIKLSGNSGTISFPVKKDESAKVYQIFSDENRDFLLIRTYLDAANGSSICTGMWLVGKADGKFVTYAKLDIVKNAGLLFDDISPSIKNGELWITGTARVYWGADPQAPPRPLSSKYNGVPVKVDGNYCTINSAVLFWDSAAQWFGIRMEN
ncbi:hypothetical protein SAMN05216587_101866 [Selenomonas ruminantium]|uniref:Uncharacterized protein n=2 Tax=Selenomonas ruminantium TaxID=971 RepID=A0A1I0VQS7_SELRU|nr:hypothetical protein SAMN05216587_101866 [Selenomonas ruminantium]